MTGYAVEAVTVGDAGRDLMDIALSGTLAPVLRDMGTCGTPVPDALDKQWPNLSVTAPLHDTVGRSRTGQPSL